MLGDVAVEEIEQRVSCRICSLKTYVFGTCVESEVEDFVACSGFTFVLLGVQTKCCGRARRPCWGVFVGSRTCLVFAGKLVGMCLGGGCDSRSGFLM